MTILRADDDGSFWKGICWQGVLLTDKGSHHLSELTNWTGSPQMRGISAAEPRAVSGQTDFALQG